MLRYPSQNLRKRNRGSAIVIVLVAVAFVFVLISTILYVTLANILMKYTDSRIKDNFYTAETVVEQMKAGIQNEASEAYSDVYRNTLTYYEAGATPEILAEYYLEKVKSNLEDKANPGKWDPEKLKSFVDPLVWGDDKLVGVQDDSYLSEAEGNHDIEIKDNNVVLKNVYIKYITGPDSADVKERNMVSVIQTDFSVGNLAGAYAYSSQVPALFDYAIIAGDRLLVQNNTHVTSQKSIYGGDEGTVIGEDSAKDASLRMQGRRYLVTKGTVSLNASGTDKPSQGWLYIEHLMTFFARDICVNGGGAELVGQTAVLDDLEYRGKIGGSVSVSGDYIGFGSSKTNPYESSAILINTKDAKFKAGKEAKVVLAGQAFVGESTDSTRFGVSGNSIGVSANGFPSNAVKTVPTSQSISAKADQVAYLIPPECIGVSNNTAYVGTNPVVRVENVTPGSVGKGDIEPDLKKYLQKEMGWGENDERLQGLKTVDFEKELPSLSGNNLAYYSQGKRYAARYVHSQYGDTLVYFYLIVDDDKKEDYLNTYYAKHEAKSNKYFRFYNADVAFEDGATFVSTVQYYTSTPQSSGGTVEFHQKTSVSADDVSGGNYEARFKSLCANLTEGEAEDWMFGCNIFDNLLKTNVSKAKAPDPTHNHSAWKTVEDAVESDGELVFTRGRGDDQVLGVLTAKDYHYDGNEKIRLIISAKNVYIDDSCDYKGMIIARNVVTCKGKKITFTADRSGLARILGSKKILEGGAEKDAPFGKRLIDYFINGENYAFALDGIASEEEAKEDDSLSGNSVDYASLVQYENYTKR